MKKIKVIFFILIIMIFFTGCFPYIYYDRDKVLLDNIDFNTTLDIAKIELDEGGFDAVLTIWAIRDQFINEEQAERINSLYFEYINKVASESKQNIREFGIWHFSWAISNIYRHGNEGIKNKLDEAYKDAKERPKSLEKFNKIAEEHINGEKIYMGDAHKMGKSYAETHIVIPGNENYVQSIEEFKDWKKNSKF